MINRKSGLGRGPKSSSFKLRGGGVQATLTTKGVRSGDLRRLEMWNTHGSNAVEGVAETEGNERK